MVHIPAIISNSLQNLWIIFLFVNDNSELIYPFVRNCECAPSYCPTWDTHQLDPLHVYPRLQSLLGLYCHLLDVTLCPCQTGPPPTAYIRLLVTRLTTLQDFGQWKAFSSSLIWSCLTQKGFLLSQCGCFLTGRDVWLSWEVVEKCEKIEPSRYL